MTRLLLKSLHSLKLLDLLEDAPRTETDSNSEVEGTTENKMDDSTGRQQPDISQAANDRPLSLETSAFA